VHFLPFADLISGALEAAWEVRNLKKAFSV